MEEKLDRCLAKNNWFDLFPSAMVHNEDTFALDHTTLILELGRRNTKATENSVSRIVG